MLLSGSQQTAMKRGSVGARVRCARNLVPSVVAPPAKRSVCARAAIDTEVTMKAKQEVAGLDMQANIEFLRKDLMHLFDDQGIDASMYDKVVDFKDPITKYDSLSGYLFNIAMLRKAFNPTFELHDIRQTTPTSITTRWTMSMEFSITKVLPAQVTKFFDPKFIFTGTSEYVFNPATGRICEHIDTWDSISNQKFFSLEGFGDFWKQLLQPYTTPRDLETPQYTVLRRASDYQVRCYEPFIVAECLMDGPAAVASMAAPQQPAATSGPSSSGRGGVNPAGAGQKAFGQLAGYIFGRNQRGEKMAMTTPVFSNTVGAMQFVIGPSSHKDVSTLPPPATPAVQTRREGGGLFAARVFNSTATPDLASQQEKELRTSLKRDGLRTADDSSWTLARYNDPSTPSFFRRNEVLIPLESFDLWA